MSEFGQTKRKEKPERRRDRKGEAGKAHAGKEEGREERGEASLVLFGTWPTWGASKCAAKKPT